MTSKQKSDAMHYPDNFHVDFKNVIGFVLAIWEFAKPAPVPYFEGINIQFFS